ncbi:MAG: SDR family oxidoreductase [Caldilineaceae bacterium]
MQITGKTALVTGGAHRVGKALTLMLAQAGANVVINYNTSGDAAQQTLDEAKALGVDGLAIQCDVADFASVQQMTQRILDHFGGVDIIVNSASLFGKTPFPSTQAEGIELWHKVTRTSIDGAFYICNSLVPSMQARGGGTIINIVDRSVWQAWHNFTAHAVGKAGLLALTQQLALELAPTIRVNAIAPGLVLPPPDFTPKQLEESTQKIPLKRWGNPQDVAHAARYLLEADYITGEVMVVDGGEQIT